VGRRCGAQRSGSGRRAAGCTPLVTASALHGVFGSESESHLGSTLKPGGAVLTGGVSRRSGSVAFVHADASPNEVLALQVYTTWTSASTRPAWFCGTCKSGSHGEYCCLATCSAWGACLTADDCPRVTGFLDGFLTPAASFNAQKDLNAQGALDRAGHRKSDRDVYEVVPHLVGADRFDNSCSLGSSAPMLLQPLSPRHRPRHALFGYTPIKC
jgi:hypothetical protein